MVVPVAGDEKVACAPTTLKTTLILGVGLPKASVTVAVTQCIAPTVLVAAGGLSVSFVGGPTVAAAVAILATKASLLPPPKVVWNAPGVVGKSVEAVIPIT